MKEKTVLIVDDNPAHCDNLEDILRDSGYAPYSAYSCAQGLKKVNELRPPVALLDLRLPDGSGTELLAKIAHSDPECLSIIITAFADVDSAVDALREGAYHFLRKPVRPEELLALLERAFETIVLRQEMRLAEKALKESERKYRLLVENANDAIFIEKDGRIVFCNPKTEKILGCSSKELADLSFMGFVHPEDKVVLDRMLKRKAPVPAFALRIKSGRDLKLWTQISSVPFQWEGSPADFYFLRDITAQKKLEAQLFQWQKTEAIGTLSGGIAHDFNNILSAIIGHTEIAMLKISKENNAYANMKSVLNAGLRARNLVKQILSYSRQSKPEMKPTLMGPVVQEALKLMRATLPVTIEIIQDIEAQGGNIIADGSQMHQVIVNLCGNAAHAMKENGGVIDVSLKRVVVNEGLAEFHPDLYPGAYWVLAISDSGHGMSPEVQKRIFDPYFTTKDTGEGTGLGLSVVQGIVKTHGGAITVDSLPGEGATFSVYLPEAENAAGTLDELQEESAKPFPTGNERILFVDDEEILTQIGKSFLEPLGYEVETRMSSVDALKLFQEQPDRFDLVITDMTMPNITGDKLALEVMKIRPEIPVILCTGFSEKITADRANALGIRRLLMKPLLLWEIATTVRSVLDGE